MSTGLNCDIVELKKSPTQSEWFYILEDGCAPKQCWDWHDYASAYGPFPTRDAARQHLSDNHPNPGGSYNYSMTLEELEKKETIKKLLAEARKNKEDLARSTSTFMRYPRYRGF